MVFISMLKSLEHEKDAITLFINYGSDLFVNLLEILEFRNFSRLK